jgi:hypothetical protein
MKEKRFVRTLFVLMAASTFLSAFPTPSHSGPGNPLLQRVSPVVQLSPETVALIKTAEKDHTQMEAMARVGGFGSITGRVDSDYTVRFDAFPRIWATAVIGVRFTGGAIFEKCLVSRLYPKVQMDAVSTAALAAGAAQPVKTLLYGEKIRRAVQRAGQGSPSADDVRTAKMAIMTALITRNIISGKLTGDVDTYLGPDNPMVDLKISVPDHEKDNKVTLSGFEFSPNQYGIATSQAGVLPGGASPFLAHRPLQTGGVIENPFHARLRERGAHEHTDVFIDLDTGLSRIVPENTLPEDGKWDICVKHMRDGWPYIRLNHLKGVAGANLGPVPWGSVNSLKRIPLQHGPKNPGILIIAHGENSPEWNLAVAYAVDRIKDVHPEYAHWPMELSFLEDEMLAQDPRNATLGLTGRSIAEALERLRAKGVSWVGVIPLMVSNCSGHLEEIRWLMGQSVEALTSEWEGTLAADTAGESGFGGILSEKAGSLSGEFAIAGFDTDVPEMEGGVGGTVDAQGNIILGGVFEGYSEDKSIQCQVTLTTMTGTRNSDDTLGGTYAGTWVKKEKNGKTWDQIASGDLSGVWDLARNETGKPDLEGLDIFLGSAIESHPLMQEIVEARTRELTDGKTVEEMGLVLGMHGADLECCSDSWHEMGEAILESVAEAMPFDRDTTQAAFMEDLGDAVNGAIADNQEGAALALHMIAPGSLTRSMPHIIGWPTIQPNVDYLYNQKTLLAFENQENLNLRAPLFSLFPSMTAEELGQLNLDATSDLFVDWMALHACELVSSYPVGDSWHGEKGPNNLLEMTKNVYVLRTNRGNYVKMRVFTAGNGMVSLEYAGRL